MSPSANVRSLESVRQFKVAVRRFEDDVTSVLAALRQEVNRAIEWLEHDRPTYWKAQVRRSFDRIAHARTDLETCRMRTVAGRRPSCIEEQVALRKAKQQLQYSQEKVEIVRRWAIKMRHDSDEYLARLGQLEQALEQDVPRMLALLERMIGALEAYVSVPSETAEFESGEPESSTGDSTAGTDTSGAQ